MKKISNYLVIITFTAIILNSCSLVKITGTKGPKTKYEVFYVGDGVLQYFIKPLKYKGRDCKLEIDYTFRDSVNDNSYITANYSLFTKEPVKDIDSGCFSIGSETFFLKNGVKFFNNKNKKKYQVRYSANITYAELKKIFYSDKNIVNLYFDSTEVKFIPKGNTLKTMHLVKDEILDIIEMNK